jgi:hypothetical protein
MWIHPKDEVKLGKEDLVVKSINGLYSSGPVSVVLEDEKTKTTTVYSLLEFNKLHDEGTVVVNTHGRKTVCY